MAKLPADMKSLKLSVKYLTAYISLLLENIVSAFFLVFIWFGIFICLWLTGFSSRETTWLFWIVLALSVAEGTLKFCFPSRDTVLHRLETESGLKHRPLQGLSDTPATRGNSEFWALEKERQKNLLSRLKFSLPSFDLARRDPYSLRIAFILVVLCALFIAPHNFAEKIKNGLFLPPREKFAVASEPTAQIEITPPIYSGDKVLIINQSSSKPVDVLQGSKIAVEIKSTWGSPVLRMGVQKILLVRKDNSDIWAGETIASDADQIRISSFGFSKFSQPVHYISDNPPEITWNGEIETLPSGELRIPLKITDDYGIKKLTLRGILATGESPQLFGSPIAIDKNLSLAMKNSAAEIKPVFDATGHPWAGLKVSLLIEAEDFAGNISDTTPLDFTLPTRNFHNRVSIELSAIRDAILHMQGTLQRIVAATENVLTQPEVYHWDTIMTLGLRSAADRLAFADTKTDLESAAGLLWELAMRMEDGGIGETQKSLQQALQDLQNAIQRGADKAEIADLMQKMQQALVQHLQNIAQKLQSQMQKSDKLQIQQSMNFNGLGDFLKKLQEDMQNGDTQSAMEKLNALQQMAEMLGSSAAQGIPKDVQNMVENLQVLQDIIERQKKLLDTTRGPDPKNLPAMTKEQTTLKDTATGLLKKIPIEIKPLVAAKDEMGLSAAELGKGNSPASIPHQEKVLNQMKQANQSMQQQLQKRMQNMMGISLGSSAGKLDPLGHQTGTNDEGIKIPDGNGKKKADEIIKTLREREGDMTRPLDERNYYQRLLKQW